MTDASKHSASVSQGSAIKVPGELLALAQPDSLQPQERLSPDFLLLLTHSRWTWGGIEVGGGELAEEHRGTLTNRKPDASHLTYAFIGRFFFHSHKTSLW